MSPSAMASTRQFRPLDVYQDLANASADQDVETALLNALGPLSDSKQNISLNPTTTTRPGSSPTKHDSSPLRPMSARGLSGMSIPPPTQPNFTTDSPRKNHNFYPMYPPAEHVPGKPLYNSFPSGTPYDKENYYTSSFGALANPYDEPDYGYKGPMKRALVDAAPLRDRTNSKKHKSEMEGEEEQPFYLPDPRDMPPIHDDGGKPAFSYAVLIGMAILRAPQRRLTLAQIYKWISDNFTHYRASETGWQNSIRHNLSLNKAFIKQERPKDDPGKGNYWAIKPGMERPFLADKKNSVRRITNPDGSAYMHGLPHEMTGMRPSTAPAIGQFMLAPNPTKKLESKAIDSAKFPEEAEPSSDATIPASDPALLEDDQQDAMNMPPPSSRIMRSSPPPHDIGSSPPPMITQSHRQGTPPPVPRFPSNSRSGGRQRKFAALNDSGYYSSIESSAARGAAHQLTSEADVERPRIKRGRAEEEIARIRSSSYDSPIKDKPAFKAPTSHFACSSPFHDEKLVHPLTPAVVFKRPAKPPASVSPNTNLRNHRNRIKALLGSPTKTFSPLPADDHFSWSPAFNIGEDGSVGLTPRFASPLKTSHTTWRPLTDTPGNRLFGTAFDIFIDPAEDLTARGSPEKKSAKRPSLNRAATTASILADITGTGKSNSNLNLPVASGSPFSFLSPFNMTPAGLRSPAKLGSPLKQSQFARTSQPKTMEWLDVENYGPPQHDVAKTDVEEFFGVELPSDGSEEAIDIFQDFGKIGQQPQYPVANVANGSPVKRTSMAPPARPGLDRRNTSRW